MKQLILVSGILALLLGACGKEQAAPVAPEAAVTPAPAAPAPAAPVAAPAPTAAPAAAAAPVAKPPAPTTAPAIASDAIEAGKVLAKASGCLACHNVEQRRVGPSWVEVSKKYKDDKGARENLIKWLHTGGTGRWQLGVMPAYSPRVSDADIEKLVDFVLSLT